MIEHYIPVPYQAALEYVDERGGGGSCGCSAGATCTCRRSSNSPALVFVHAGLYQEESLAIESDVQLIGM